MSLFPKISKLLSVCLLLMSITEIFTIKKIPNILDNQTFYQYTNKKDEISFPIIWNLMF